VWPTDVEGWWESGIKLIDNDQRLFADGWWELQGHFASQGVFLFYPVPEQLSIRDESNPGLDKEVRLFLEEVSR
jgi:hypothetical protein